MDSNQLWISYILNVVKGLIAYYYDIYTYPRKHKCNLNNMMFNICFGKIKYTIGSKLNRCRHYENEDFVYDCVQ